MRQNKFFVWFLIVVGGFYLLSRIVTNDMGGLASLGYNPDAPIYFQSAPVRFLIGIGLDLCAIVAGFQMLGAAPPPENKG